MEAESYSQLDNGLDDGTCRLDAGGTDRPVAQHKRDYIRHFDKNAAFIRAGSAGRR
jgi:hypothetical protein